MTLNSTSTLLLASGNDAELLARWATGLSMWINDERRLVSGKLRKFPAGHAGKGRITRNSASAAGVRRPFEFRLYRCHARLARRSGGSRRAPVAPVSAPSGGSRRK